MEDSKATSSNGAVDNNPVADSEAGVSESKSSNDMLAQIRDVLGDEIASAFESKFEDLILAFY